MENESKHYRYYNDWLRTANAWEYNTVDDAIKGLYIKLYSASKIAYLFNVTKSTITYHLKRLNVPLRNKGGGNNVRWMYQGISLRQYCNKHEVSIDTVRGLIYRGWSVEKAVQRVLNKDYSRRRQYNQALHQNCR